MPSTATRSPSNESQHVPDLTSDLTRNSANNFLRFDKYQGFDVEMKPKNERISLGKILGKAYQKVQAFR
jgi:hypothetical protein